MSTALYRRYRPETFADVIGQEHVTEPLMAAIDKDRINHAYLFSGPRGCGKTTSARILARCLNCAQGPTSTPCGTCDSCVELARNGSGSLDVIEIDAASHGGVDDARDLRERATFAPVRDRFKIFIIDEAHMVTSAGFNALLKIVEEPPEHILFIFATTEPDKVIGTIRSRTHHYPFRLVPPEPLMAYLELLCRQENVPVAPGVLSLVIRAGGGSVRDSLSVLDQLMAGAGESGLDYELAVSLLGYTHATLLDDVVDSVAAGDAATVFNAVDRVIQTGHDPRRFVEDLLERFRDLIVINAVPEGAASILRGVPDDQLNRMRTQANQLGAGELSRAADVTNTALTEMTGATSPRLHLELLCARLLLPAADATARGTLARVDRIERRLEYAAGTPAAEAPAADEAPKPPARPRLDGVPRTAEEAAARWSLPTADPATPAVPAAVPGAHSPAVPSAGRVKPPVGAPDAADSSPDWGGSWGVSTESAFSAPDPANRPAGRPEGPAVAGSTGPSEQDPPAAQTAPMTGNRASTPVRTDGDPQAQGSPPDPAQASASVPAGQALQFPASSNPPAPVRDLQPGDAQGQHPAPSSGPAGLSSTGQDGALRASQASPQQGMPQQGAPQRGPGQGGQGQQESSQGSPQGPLQGRQGQPPQEVRPDAAQQGQPAASGGNVEMVRRAWPEILDEVARIKRATWLIVNVAAKPRSFEGNQLVLAFAHQGNAIGFQRGPHMDNLKQAIHKVLGLTCSIEAVHDAGGAGESGPKAPASQAAPGSNPGPVPSAPGGGHGSPTTSPGAGAQPGAESATEPAGPSDSFPPSVAGADRGAGTIAGAVAGVSGGIDAAAAGSAGTPVSARPAPERPDAGSHPGNPASPAEPASAPSNRPTPAEPASMPGELGDLGPTTDYTAAPAGTAPIRPARDSAPATHGTDPSQSAAAPPHKGPDAGVGRGALPLEQGNSSRTSGTPAQSGPSPSSGTGSRAAGQSARATNGMPGGAREGGAAKGEIGTTSRRGATRGPAASTDPVPEAVSAWDPSMSDDSWALVEPPEEAFDPGPDWGSVPDDPYDRRSSKAEGADAARPERAQEPGRAGLTTAREAQTPQPDVAGPASPSPSGATAAPAAPVPAPATPAADAPRSRSVVWSPPVAPASAERGAKPAVPTPPPGDAGRAAPPEARPDAEATTGSPASATWSGPATSGSGVAPTPARSPGAAASDRAPSAENVRQKPVSRYQQLLDEAERKRAEEAAAARGAVDLRFVEDEPSADDETIEESGLVGRTAIERILNGRLIEERSVNGQ